MSPEKRIELMIRTVALLRVAIENNNNVYSGTLAPNLQSIVDLGTINNEQLLLEAEQDIEKVEKKFRLLDNYL